METGLNFKDKKEENIDSSYNNTFDSIEKQKPELKLSKNKLEYPNLFDMINLKNKDVHINNYPSVPIEVNTKEDLDYSNHFNTNPHSSFSNNSFPLEKNFHSLILDYTYNVNNSIKNNKNTTLDSIIKYYYLDKKYFLNPFLFNYSYLKHLKNEEESFAKVCKKNNIIFTKMDLTVSCWDFHDIKNLGFKYDLEIVIKETGYNNFFSCKENFKCDFLLIKFKRKKKLSTLFKYCDITIRNFCDPNKIDWMVIKKYYKDETIYESVKPFLDRCELRDIKKLKNVEIMKTFKINNIWLCRKFSSYREYNPEEKNKDQKYLLSYNSNRNNDKLKDYLRKFTFMELISIGFDSDSIRIFGFNKTIHSD